MEYDADVYIMRPTDVSKGNRKLLYRSTSWPNALLLPCRFRDLADLCHLTRPQSTMRAMGLFRQATPGLERLGPDAPAPIKADHTSPAAADGQPIVQTIRDEFIFGTRRVSDPAHGTSQLCRWDPGARAGQG